MNANPGPADPARPTRGAGLLESMLSRQRARKAMSLIQSSINQGRVLDVGCGSYPVFLSLLTGHEKFGLDRALSDDVIGIAQEKGVKLLSHDFSVDSTLPFDANSLEVVTMLAVFEHLEHHALDRLLRDIHRVLVPGGVYIMTTPAVWTDALLRFLSKVGLVSPEEIDEHLDAYSHAMISEHLISAGFDAADIELGHFQMFMNNWCRAKKQS